MTRISRSILMTFRAHSVCVGVGDDWRLQPRAGLNDRGASDCGGTTAG